MREMTGFEAGGLRLFLMIVMWVAVLVFAAAPASAEKGLFPSEDFGSVAQPSFIAPAGMAVDQSSNDLLVLDARGINEVQRVTISATAGQFKLEFGGDVTADIAFNASATTVRDALRALASIGSPNANVSGGPGNAGGTSPYVVTFTSGLAQRDVEQIACVTGTTPLSGGSGCSVTTSTPGSSDTLSRWNSDGTPSNFAALGTNVIDGALGGVDETPEGNLDLAGNREMQVAIDNSGGVTDGNIYVTQSLRHKVYVFSGDGVFLGELTAAGAEPFGDSCGVGIDQDGNVYTSDFDGSEVHKFDPVANPPVNADHLMSFPVPGSPCTLAAGTGPTDGYLFVNGFNSPHETVKLDSTTGELQYQFGSGHLTVTTDPATGHLYAARGSEVAQYDVSGIVKATELASGAASSTVNGVAFDGSDERLYVARSSSEQIEIFTLLTTPEVSIEPATDVSATAATVNGSVNPDGVELTECNFEYGTSTAYGNSIPCKETVPGDSFSHNVSAVLTGLQNGTTYHYRLVVENSDGREAMSEDATFETVGPPAIIEQLPLNITQTTATLRAKVKPFGAPTSYHFEWGTDSTYGNRIPADHDLIAGAGFEPVSVTAHLTGLNEEAVYHFRVVASNTFGDRVGIDREFSTLNSDGLPWGRRYELVSPPDKGPAAQAADQVGFGGAELQFQATPDGNAIAYPIAYGMDDATNGGEVAFRSDRGPGSWLTAQVAPSAVGGPPPFMKGESNITGYYNRWLSADLGCGFSNSALPLGGDPVELAALEAGGLNLYRRDAGGNYDLVSNLIPTNLGAATPFVNSAYRVPGASEDCRRVLFETAFRYPGVANSNGIYEWNEGVLGNPASIPGPSGPVFPASAWIGGPSSGAGDVEVNSQNALSRDGSRLFFTAQSALGGDAGKQAIFLSVEGAETIDVSQSQTVTPNDGASRYQMATPDGAHVFFIARYGLAQNGSSTGSSACSLTKNNNLGVGCDLYRYTTDSGELTDLSPSANPADTSGASVAGVLATSEDGSRVYFAAKGQLVPERGQSFAENTASATRGYNIYLSDEGDLSYVATIPQIDVTGLTEAGVLVPSGRWASRTTPGGNHLVFQATGAVTGYDSGGVVEAYRYSADSEEVECVSCRRDGQPSLGIGSVDFGPLPTIEESGNRNHPIAAMSDDGSTIIFRKKDALAVGARNVVSGAERNLYVWREGQISLLASDIPGVSLSATVELMGASADGSSIFFRSKRALVPWDTDGRQDVYAARVGGGFPPPPEPQEPCDPLRENSCAEASSDAGTHDTPASSSFQGKGNARDPQGAINHCSRPGRRAKALSARAKHLARRASRVARNDRWRAMRMNRKARRLARRAKGLSNHAKRCRARASRRANTSRRAGR